jgi:hypothetical protein
MSQSVNFQTTNPAQFPDRLTELQVAVQLDEANNFAVAEYTAAGAIALGGKAFLKAGSAAAMTLALPLAGAQNAGGQDGLRMSIVALDAYDYTVTTPADGINGADDTATFGGAAGDNIELIAFGGAWYTIGTPKGVTLSEV